jgi:ABC-type ATPase with predicted acetyltransferase domain
MNPEFTGIWMCLKCGHKIKQETRPERCRCNGEYYNEQEYYRYHKYNEVVR